MNPLVPRKQTQPLAALTDENPQYKYTAKCPQWDHDHFIVGEPIDRTSLRENSL